MPYVDSKTRFKLDVEGRLASTSGELAYEIYKELVAYVNTKELSWQTCSDVLGALDGCKQEFKINYSIPYEQKKKEENGDIR